MSQAEVISIMETEQQAGEDFARNDGPPVNPTSTELDQQAAEEAISLLRRFHLGEPEAIKSTKKIGDDIFPALLNAYRYGAGIRFDYPLYLRPVDQIDDGVLAQSLADFLIGLVDAYAPEENAARILKDNLLFIERYIRRAAETSTEPMDAADLVVEAGNALQEQLDLEGEHRQALQKDLDGISAGVLPGSRFLSYGPYVTLHLFEQAVEYYSHVQQEQFQAEVHERIRKLSQMIDVEDERAVDGGQPEGLKQRVGDAGSYFNSSSLSGVLKHKKIGSLTMSPDRRERIEHAIKVLSKCKDSFTPIQYVCQTDSPWDTDAHGLELIADPDPCSRAAQLYDEQAARYSDIFAAYRIAKLEIDAMYDPAVHDSWFDNFDWEAFSAEEMQLVPITVALVTCNHLATAGMQSLSRLLSSRRPVHVLAWVQAHTNPGNLSPDQTDYRTELAYLGIGHRQANVAQTSASRYSQLLSGFLGALENFRTSLHLINSEHTRGPVNSTLNPWMMASAALEARAHPYIQVIPGGQGEPVEKVDFSGNPSPETNWSHSQFVYRDESGKTTEIELPFTYVDYCLLKPTRYDNFRPVPEGCTSDDLVDVETYLAADESAVDRMIPFVYAVDGKGRLQKLVFSRRLAMECRDRLSFWQALQALAGVRNFYVDRMREQVIEEQRAEREKEKAELIAAHREELSQVETEAAAKVLGRLADVLVGLDLTNPAAAAAAAPSAAPAKADVAEKAEAVEEAPEQVAAAEEEDDLGFNDPYIDSVMCSSCDDCMKLNKIMFAYNEDKQAYITDPKTGTYAQLVEAAEKCPARCIHPGKPLNLSEPGLEELMKRAEPYN